jgi:hypothetical protein
MTDNIVNVSFKQQSDLESLLDNIKEMKYDSIVFVGKAGDKIYVGTSRIEDISSILGDLHLAQQYIALQAFGG